MFLGNAQLSCTYTCPPHKTTISFFSAMYILILLDAKYPDTGVFVINITSELFVVHEVKHSLTKKKCLIFFTSMNMLKYSVLYISEPSAIIVMIKENLVGS